MAIQDDSFNRFFGTAGDTASISSDISGAAHQKYAADQAAAEKLRQEQAAQQAAYIQAQTAPAPIYTPAPTIAPAPAPAPALAIAPDPYAGFYGLSKGQQRRASARPAIALSRYGITVPANLSGPSPASSRQVANPYYTGPAVDNSQYTKLPIV